MAVYGDQWHCACQTNNFFMRQRCRECGAAKPAEPEIVPWPSLFTPLAEDSPGVPLGPVNFIATGSGGPAPRDG